MAPTSQQLITWLTGALPSWRWFAAKDSPITSVRIVARAPLPHGVAAEWVAIEVVTTAEPQLYQLLVNHDGEGLSSGFADPDTIAAFLTACQSGDLPLRIDWVDGNPPEWRPRLLGVEQSNTSVEASPGIIHKFFRRLEPGVNPDVELLGALTPAGCRHSIPLRGTMQLTLHGQQYTAGLFQDYLTAATDGFVLATASASSALTGGDGDFSAEAERIGTAIADVHRSLAGAFPVAPATAAALLTPLRARVRRTAGAVPELEPYLVPADHALAGISGTGEVQRIHGDLHLGQLLKDGDRWVVIDFEGEPTRSIPERREPDSRARDIAGMLRSFDYAAFYPLLGNPQATDEQRALASAWRERAGAAFLAGYAQLMELPAAELISAFELDKAVYEVAYEAGHRPAWIGLPLAAVRRLVGVR